MAIYKSSSNSNSNTAINNISGETEKIDSKTTDGLLGVNNSLAYRVHEIEKHFHGPEYWYGTDGDGTMSRANNMTAWTLTAGAINVYGGEILLGSGADILVDDPTCVRFDLHRILITGATQVNDAYIIQIWNGSGAFGAASLATEAPFYISSNFTRSTPLDIQMGRLRMTDKLWARVKSTHAAAETTILIGMHCYAG